MLAELCTFTFYGQLVSYWHCRSSGGVHLQTSQCRLCMSISRAGTATATRGIRFYFSRFSRVIGKNAHRVGFSLMLHWLSLSVTSKAVSFMSCKWRRGIAFETASSDYSGSLISRRLVLSGGFFIRMPTRRLKCIARVLQPYRADFARSPRERLYSRGNLTNCNNIEKATLRDDS